MVLSIFGERSTQISKYLDVTSFAECLQIETFMT